ncbi:MAG TPA: hypothetical protein VHD60_03515 [Candidatus Saccharimonadales bacterium]|nr:hypothetical protein [Candidatus Saccharimonadales bacterium]
MNERKVMGTQPTALTQQSCLFVSLREPTRIALHNCVESAKLLVTKGVIMSDRLKNRKMTSNSERNRMLRRDLTLGIGTFSLVAALVGVYKSGQAVEKNYLNAQIASTYNDGWQTGAAWCKDNMNDEHNLGTFMLTFSDVAALADVRNAKKLQTVSPSLAQALSVNGVKHVRVVPQYRGSVDQVSGEMGQVYAVLDELETTDPMVFTTLLSTQPIKGMSNDDEMMIEVDQVICSNES